MQGQTVFHFVLAALATWRLAFLLAREDGPWSALVGFRRVIGKGILGKLFQCVKCVGIWISIPFAFFVGGTRAELLVTWLALAGVTALIDEATRPPFEFQETADEELLRRDADSTID